MNGVADFETGREAKWRCKCTCGKEKRVSGYTLRAGISKSCGCLRTKLLIQRFTKHGYGHRRTPEYNIWKTMRARCTNPNSVSWENYGGRGIGICDRWSDFALFLEDMGERPSKNHSVDRINNSGNYEPGNCRWATQQEQCNNTRSNRFVTVNGERKTIAQWARKLGVRPDYIAGKNAVRISKLLSREVTI